MPSLYWLIFRLRLWLGRKLLPRRYPETVDEWYACYPQHRVQAKQIMYALDDYFPDALYRVHVQSFHDGPAWDRYLVVTVFVEDCVVALPTWDRFCEDWLYNSSYDVHADIDWRYEWDEKDTERLSA